MIFRLEYCNKFGDTARVDITTPGLPTVVEVEGAGDPFRLKYTPDVNDKSFRFLTSSAEINIYETPEFNIDTLKTSSETDIKVEMYINGVKDWIGFVLPDFFSKEIRGNAIVSMTASDRISTLKGVTLSDLPAFIYIRELCVQCLAKTGLDLPLNTMVDFLASQIGFNDYFRSEIPSQRLVDNKGRSISCYDILNSILVTSNSFLEQRKGEWYIINKLQHELGEGELYSSPNTHTTYSEVTHNFSEITKGAMRTIIPVAASVGVFHEHGGGRMHPDNYDFSKDLTGWNKINDINAWIDNRQIEGYENIGGVLTPKYGISTEKKYLVIRDEVYGAGKNAYLESDAIDIPYINSDGVDVTFDVSGIAPVGGELRFSVVAKKGSDVIALNETGSFVSMGSGPIYRRLKGFEKSGEVKSMSVSGSLIVENISQWKLSIRIYGVGNISTVIVNEAIITMKNSQTAPKGNLYKREQGSNFTKSHDIETSIFGDYITGGLNGYFYDYPIDDTSSLYSQNGNLRERWIDPTDHNSEELPLLQHVVRQKARMFSVAHDLIRGEIEMVNFDPLAIFVDCSGKRYSLVSAEVDFLRSSVNVELEEIAYVNLTVRDYIYSYFGEGESGIKSVGGIASGSGVGTGGGGMTNDQIAILNDVAELAHSHENKEVLDQITQDMVDNASREMVTSTDTETELSDENYLSSLRTIKEITDRSISKITEDEAQEVITFLKGIIAGGTSYFVNLIASGKITAENIDVNDTLKTQILQAIVRAELQDVILKGQLNSETFTSGFLGSGFRLSKIGDRWVLELDDLIVRKTMQIYELIVQRIRYQGGQVIHSPAGGKITKVTNGGSYWRVEHDSPDDFITNDQVQCQNFKVGSAAQNPDGSTTFEGVSVKRYWRLVTSYGRGWFNLSKTDMEAGSAEPEVGDDIVVLGNRTDPTRQNAYMIVSTGANSPYTAHLSGINSYSTAGKEKVREGNLSGIVDPDFGQLSGYGLYGQNVFLKGIFRLTNGQLVTDFMEDRITLAVSDKVDKDKILASINLSEEGVKISGEKIQFTGSVSFQAAAKEVADASVNDLKIGDVNLARYSGAGYYLNSAGVLSGIYSDDRSKSSVVTESGVSAIRVQGGGLLRIAGVAGLTAGKTYTWRIMIKGTTDLTGLFQHYAGSGYGSTNVTITEDWAVYTNTFVCQGIYEILHIYSLSDTFYIADWMLVEGNKVTEGWNANILDVEGKINDAKQEALTAADGYMRARYIRDWAGRNTANNYSLWYEVKVFNKAGVNVAQGKSVEGKRPAGSSPYSNITDGNTTTYGQPSDVVPEGETDWIKIDLGQIYYDIDYINIWHHSSDSRTYYGTKTEISEDGVNWTTIFDSAVSGTYQETEQGKVHTFRPASVQAKLNTAAAITDKFRTTINGGLINTVIMELREADTENVTAGISGIQNGGNGVAFWAGGTYAAAKAIIRHNGTVKFTEAEITGLIRTAESGRRIVLDPSSNPIAMTIFDAGDHPIISVGFQNYPDIDFGIIKVDNRSSGNLLYRSELIGSGFRIDEYENGSIKRTVFNILSISGQKTKLWIYDLPTSQPTEYNTVWADSSGYLRIRNF